VLYAAIFLGGALGAVARYAMAARIHARFGTAFPWGTLAVNLSGSFGLGLCLPALLEMAAAAPLRGFLSVGLLGAFTTFSTFAHETVRLAADGRPRRAAAYTAVSLLLGLACIAAGLALGAMLL
jgi:fluoride exporter